PLTILIAMIVPGNRILPFGDLATIGFFIALAVGIHKGNLFRTLISGSIIMYITIWIANQTIPLTTALAKAANSNLLARSPEISALDQGGCPITYILTQLLHTTNVTGLIVIGLLYAFCIVFTYVQYRKKKIAKEAAAGEQAAKD
ncbi:MAG TPA: PTS galactitol transporter subunit IIC, partial [Ruminococcaceae bacterium]|nr:PTS galactitol transporter subunit IIC [Oscillospiraceae bacterium]